MRILYVENHAEFAATVCASFLADHEVQIAPSIASARIALRAARFDAILVDYDLDDGKGDEIVRWARLFAKGSKLVAVSSHDDGNQALLRAGAHATCPKLRFSQIRDVLGQLIGEPPT